MKFDYFIEKYSKLVYKICYDMLSNSLDAEDVTQEVYINFYKSFDRYSQLEENEIKNIICKIALNKCKDVLKSKIRKLDNITTNDVISLEKLKDNSTMEEILKNDKEKRFHELINTLKEPYNLVIYDYYVQGFSLDEIAKKMKVPKQTLKMQLYRAKKMLREKIIEIGGEDLL